MIYRHEKNPPAGPVELYPTKTASLMSVMSEYLTGRGLSFACACENSWYPTDELDDIPRLVIPATNIAGTRFWQARAMIDVPDRLRWKSAKGARGEAVVICWPPTLRGRTKIVVVEGPLDALAVATSNNIGIAAMGKANVGGVINYLKNEYSYKLMFRDLPVIVVPDLDAIEFGGRAVAELALAGISAKIRVPPYEDLAALTVEEREELLR